jgi:hypothetical protein
MAKASKSELEKSILPLKYVDMVEDIFHAVLALALVFAIFLSKSAQRRSKSE